MSTPDTEGLRKAARRIFWEAKQIEQKSIVADNGNQKFAQLRALLKPIEQALNAAAEGTQARFCECGRPFDGEADFMAEMAFMGLMLSLVSYAMDEIESGGDGKEAFRFQFAYQFMDRRVPASIRNEVPEFTELLDVLELRVKELQE